MLFLYPPSPQSRIADILFWTQIVFVAVFAFFLLVEYLNSHQITHLLWAMAFIATWITYHLVALTSNFSVLHSSIIAGFGVFIPGAIASGLLFNIFGREKKILGIFSIGSLWLLLVIILAVFIGLLSLSGMFGPYFVSLRVVLLPDAPDWAWFPKLFVMGLNTANAIVIIGLPIYTTVKTKETSSSAYLISIGGVLMSISGILLAETYAGIADNVIAAPLIVYTTVPAFVFYVFGMLYENKWKFNIPGIEFEEAARVDISLPGGKKLYGALLGLLGSIVLFAGSMLVFPIVALDLVGDLQLASLLGLVFPILLGAAGIIAVLAKWGFTKYMKLIVGALAVVDTVLLLVLYLTVAETLNLFLLGGVIVSCLVLIGAVLDQVIKE